MDTIQLYHYAFLQGYPFFFCLLRAGFLSPRCAASSWRFSPGTTARFFEKNLFACVGKQVACLFYERSCISMARKKVTRDLRRIDNDDGMKMVTSKKENAFAGKF
jgi:hypothetical protein